MLADVLKERRTYKTSYRLSENGNEIDSFKVCPLMIVQKINYRNKEFLIEADSVSTIDYLLKCVECKRENVFYYSYQGEVGKSLVARTVLSTISVIVLMILTLFMLLSVLLFLMNKIITAISIIVIGLICYRLSVFNKVATSILLSKFSNRIKQEIKENRRA